MIHKRFNNYGKKDKLSLAQLRLIRQDMLLDTPQKNSFTEKTKPEKPRSLSTQAAPLAEKLDAHERAQQQAQLARACSAAAGSGEMGW